MLQRIYIEDNGKFEAIMEGDIVNYLDAMFGRFGECYRYREKIKSNTQYGAKDKLSLIRSIKSLNKNKFLVFDRVKRKIEIYNIDLGCHKNTKTHWESIKR